MILYNDSFIEKDEISIQMEDRGYQFGDGVYEVIRIYNGICFELNAHIERLMQSSIKIGMSLPYSSSVIETKLLNLVEMNHIDNGTIYVQVTRGVAPRTHHIPNAISPIIIAYVSHLNRPISKSEKGVKTILLEDIRWRRCDIKSINLLANVMSKQEAKNQNCEESILHRNGIVTEGSSTNVFVVKNGKVYTPPANNFILQGITRNKVIKDAKTNHIEIEESSFTTGELLNADEVFITSTTLEVTPVIQIDNHIVGNGQPGDITIQLRQFFDAEITMQTTQ